MKMFRLLLVLMVIPFMCVSCEDEPVLETPNKLVGTRWVQSTEMQALNNPYEYNSIEFCKNDWCICTKEIVKTGMDNTTQSVTDYYFVPYTYDETTNKIWVDGHKHGVMNTDTKVCVFDLSEQYPNNPEFHCATYIQDVNYVAPEANNKLAHTKWAATYKTKNDYILEFLDNSRLIFNAPTELTTTRWGKTVHNYTYIDGALTIDGENTYKFDGNKIKIGNYTFKKQ